MLTLVFLFVNGQLVINKYFTVSLLFPASLAQRLKSNALHKIKEFAGLLVFLCILLIYLGRGTSETCLVSSAGRPSGPRDLSVIKNDKRMPSVCDQDSLECVSLEERRARKLK